MTKIDTLKKQLDTDIQTLDEWGDTPHDAGESWNAWDEHYKNAAYRINCTRELIDAASSPESESEWSTPARYIFRFNNWLCETRGFSGCSNEEETK
jgi:hypothetical protein